MARYEAPTGFHWSWEPEPETHWRLVVAEHANRKCRWARSGCPNSVAAELNRGKHVDYYPYRVDVWWTYCAEHLYGRRIRNGRIEHEKLVPDAVMSVP